MIKKPLLLIIISFVLSTLPDRVFAQKGEYIVLQDTALTQGIVTFPGTGGITSVNFTTGKRKKFTTYYIKDISEFSFGGKQFFRRTIITENRASSEFLELLPHDKKDVNLWRLHENPFRYFIEKDSVIKELGDGYQNLLKEWLDDPNIDLLIDKTKVNESDLLYLLKTANEIQKPRTFTKPFVFTPYVGVASIWHKYLIPSTFTLGSHQSFSPTFGFNAEGFLNHKRNISINAGFQTLYFNSSEFVTTAYRGSVFESDINVKFHGIQFPVFGRIYYDYIPNKMRLYSEFGILFSLFEIQYANSFEARISGETINTQKLDFEFPKNHTGFLFGFGLERYLKGHRGIVLGVRGSVVNSGPDSGLSQIQLHSGFKF